MEGVGHGRIMGRNCINTVLRNEILKKKHLKGFYIIFLLMTTKTVGKI